MKSGINPVAGLNPVSSVGEKMFTYIRDPNLVIRQRVEDEGLSDDYVMKEFFRTFF